MEWHELFAALALMLVLEGILPFLSPRAWRLFAIKMAAYNDKQFRIFGLVLMLVGVLILFVVHHFFY